jgi:hypothetical protein
MNDQPSLKASSVRLLATNGTLTNNHSQISIDKHSAPFYVSVRYKEQKRRMT